MSAEFKLIDWNARKLIYDAILITLLLAWMTGFVVLGLREQPEPKLADVLMGGFGTAALIMLHIILAIGPLARLDRRFLTLLYNRRHFGVMMFLVAATHASFGISEVFDADGDTPLAALLFGTKTFAEAGFPFELLGFGAILILSVMAFSSHDVWLSKLTPAVWKWLHMGVYLAYGLIVVHVMLAKLMSENSTGDDVYTDILILGAFLIVTLHITAGFREAGFDSRSLSATNQAKGDHWLEVGTLDDIPNNRAKIITPPKGERIAVFRHDGTVCAIANICAHQGGPLGEGQIIDGLITCPWHGHQFQMHNGCAPAPYTDRVVTYPVRVEGQRVFVNPSPLPAGTSSEPVIAHGSKHS